MQLQHQILKLVTIGLLSLGLFSCGGGSDDPAVVVPPVIPEPPTLAEYQLVWADEFDGTSLDTSKWDIQTGDGTQYGNIGWGNAELQYYTPDNLTVVDGNLVITARVGDSPNSDYNFTSGRIRTQGKLDFVYGRVEASIKVPEGLGLWGAFWMLGSDGSPFGTWAARGEIDIMESFGQDTQFSQATVHFGMAFPLNESASYIKNDVDPTDGFHQYAVEWDQEKVRWFIDGEHFYTVSADAYWAYYYDGLDQGFLSGEGDAPFNANQHILLNLAVGGNPAGTPNANDMNVFPGEMIVEYVRVYECPIEPVSNGLGCEGSIDAVNPLVSAIGSDKMASAQDVQVLSYDLYIDAPSSLFASTSSERQLGIGVFDSEGALVANEVAATETERGNVIDIKTLGGGNVQINDVDGNTFNLFGVGSATDPGNYGGELSFDVKLLSEGTDMEGSLLVKMDSGFPDIGFVDIPFSSLPADDWRTINLRMSDVMKGNAGAFGGKPLNIKEVLNLIVFEPTAASHLQIDNVRLKCGAPQSRRCGIVRVSTVPADVFIDDVDSIWSSGIGASDSPNFASYNDGTNPSGTNKVEWQIIGDDDTSRFQIIDVTFNDSDTFGVWYIQSAEAVDLAGYAGGAVVFDLFVKDYGNNTDGMTMKIDCLFPCTSGDQALGVVADGVWETIEVPVSRLIDSGLNPGNTNTGLVLFPTSQRGNINFKVDNIRWEPSTSFVPEPLSYAADFESSDAQASTLGDKWLSFASVFNAAGDFIYNYGDSFATPNNTGAFANITSGEGSAAQGTQSLTLLNDYLNDDHRNGLGRIIETITYQERVLNASDTGTYTLSFDAKVPLANGIVRPSQAFAFIKILDPTNGFSTSSNVEIELTDISNTQWQKFTLTIAINGDAQTGQLLQFGVRNLASAENASEVLIDNVVLQSAEAMPQSNFIADFEMSNADADFIGDGWLSFGAIFNTAGELIDQYGPFASPNKTDAFTGIAGGEGGDAQGAKYLNVFSDYGNAGHGNGLTIQALSFQERSLTATDGGTYRLSFDVKAPQTGGIAAPTTAFAFVKTLDPNTGFATTENVELNMSNVSNTEWQTFTMDLFLELGGFNGQILQFGFSNSSTAFNPSGIYYDNISLVIVR